MASMAQKVGLVVLGGALGTGGTVGFSELSKSRDGGSEPKPVEVKKNYTEIDANTFIIAGGRSYASLEDGLIFGKNLSEFRKTHSGDFILIPGNNEQPFLGATLAVRKESASEDGKSNAIGVRSGTPDKK